MSTGQRGCRRHGSIMFLCICRILSGHIGRKTRRILCDSQQGMVLGTSISQLHWSGDRVKVVRGPDVVVLMVSSVVVVLAETLMSVSALVSVFSFLMLPALVVPSLAMALLTVGSTVKGLELLTLSSCASKRFLKHV
ncbi:hypothetical protein QBC38DRAFT_80266 [Podospora fimiseda]|uniref:Uncharacterized protein n=1 Tax=Podospora fimiseda TaxID=252190 RepID=A0AAN7BGQ6_9PEZI|nr:hypothetical protein QBC38DRAFT_80266 [Podospora fimiseda]